MDIILISLISMFIEIDKIVVDKFKWDKVICGEF